MWYVLLTQSLVSQKCSNSFWVIPNHPIYYVFLKNLSHALRADSKVCLFALARVHLVKECPV